MLNRLEFAYNETAREQNVFRCRKVPCIQTPQVWIPGTVKVFRQRQIAVTPKFRFT
jgi:hypothetical protein